MHLDMDKQPMKNRKIVSMTDEMSERIRTLRFELKKQWESDVVRDALEIGLAQLEKKAKKLKQPPPAD